MTATLGSRMYSASRFLMVSATSLGVYPPAATSPMIGTEILPSGLTGAVTDSSGFRHTVTCTRSSTPMRYSSTFTNGWPGVGVTARSRRAGHSWSSRS